MFRLANVEIMILLVRTQGQAEKAAALLAKYGLKRGENGLRLIMMCEVPSNAILAEKFLQYFGDFSIGSNDLTQLTLGLDRDPRLELLAKDLDERDKAVNALLSLAIWACRFRGQVHRHLWPRTIGQPGLRDVGDRPGHRVDVAQSGSGNRYLAQACDRVKSRSSMFDR
jgi:hypothetical protein